jgi:hypothetical protein
LAGKRFSTGGNDVNLNSVTPGFFSTMGVKVIAGRNFDDRDIAAPGEQGWRSAIVNEAFVKRYLAGRNPLGVHVCQGSGPDAKPNIEIVGVVANFSYRGIREESEQAFSPSRARARPHFTCAFAEEGNRPSRRFARSSTASIQPCPSPISELWKSRLIVP